MRLLASTDFSLRLLMHLAQRQSAAPGAAPVSTQVLAEAIAVPRNHVHKIVQDLAEAGFVRTFRGPQGGVTLARDPAAIAVGAVVRHLEANQAIVECFRPDGGTCCLTPGCRLRTALAHAQHTFLASLDTVTIADCLPTPADG